MTPKAETAASLKALGVCAFLVLAVVFVFGQTAHFEFVNYDDGENVFQNSTVQKGLSIELAGWAFTHAQMANLIPLTTLSHMLDCQLFGLDAGKHHLVNVFWHAGNAILLFLVLRQLTGSLWRSALVAALFAVHPLRAESVAWVSERKDVLSGFFFLLTISAYARYARKPSVVVYGMMMLLFALGLMAKSMVATLPFVLLLLDYWPLERFHNRQELLHLVWEKIPLLALAAADCVCSAVVPGLMITDANHLPFLSRVANAVVSDVIYMRQMIWPTGLATPYPLGPHGLPWWQVGPAILLLAALSAGVVACRKRRPCLLMGWLWFLGMLFPVIGIIQISAYVAYADRYTYLPEIGLTVAGVWALADWSAGRKYWRMALTGLSVAAIGALAAAAKTQTSYWQDSETLWTRALACTANNHVAHYNRGMIFLQSGDTDDSAAEFRQAAAIKPDYAPALNNLGGNLAAKGENDEAIALYRKALAADPAYYLAHCNLGHSLVLKGKFDEAIVHFREAVRLNPDYPDTHFGLGEALLAKKSWEEAGAQLGKAMELKPNIPGIRRDLGRALLLKGDFDGAMACFEQDDPPSSLQSGAQWYDLGGDFLKKNQLEEAIACYQQATRLDAQSADARAYLGLAYVEDGKVKEAIEAWRRALAIRPDLIMIRNNLAWLLATTQDASLRNGAEATAEAEKANQLSGGANPGILHTLAAAYAEAGRYGDATSVAKRALELTAGQNNSNLTAKLEKELKLYQENTPLRIAPKLASKL